MVRIITADDIKSLIHKLTLKNFFIFLLEKMEEDFSRWQQFKLMPRVATHFEHGVIELMPISNNDYYSFKYINGHPRNPEKNKQTVAGVGLLADVDTGYPLLISEMTLLTALRTAAVSALASKYLASPACKTFGIIGTGAQSEFQVLAHQVILGIEKVKYFDIDLGAMNKFARNLKKSGLTLIKCQSAQEVVEESDIITTATAVKKRAQILQSEWIKPGMHINGIGGDCPGKTELDIDILYKAKIVVELLDQTALEGEIQCINLEDVYAELWEIITKRKPGRVSPDEITLFDSVGFALEDYSILRLVYYLAQEFHIGHMLDMIPATSHPKDLFSYLL